MGMNGTGQRIKSMQTVLVTIAAGNQSGTATISSTVAARTQVENCGAALGGAATDLSYGLARVSQTSATQLTAQRNGVGGGMPALEVQAQVIEYE